MDRLIHVSSELCHRPMTVHANLQRLRTNRALSLWFASGVVSELLRVQERYVGPTRPTEPTSFISVSYPKRT
jgi:hypothetical protein